MRWLFGLIGLLLATTCGHAQGRSFLWVLQAPLVGSTPITATGFDFTSSPALYSTSTATRQFGAPFTDSFWIKTSLAGFSPNFLNIIGNVPAANTTGKQWTYTTSSEATFSLTFIPKPGGNSTSSCVGGRVCARWSLIDDGNWHHVCGSFQGNAQPLTLYIDGQLRDQNLASTVAFTNSTAFWNIGIGSTAMQMRSVREYTIALSQNQCQRIYQYGQAGFIPSAPDVLASNMAMDVELGNCTGTPPALTCPDAIDGVHPFTTDQTPPTVSVTNPPASPPSLTGSVSLTATCTDAIQASKVDYYIGTFNIGSSTAGGTWPVTWNSATVVDATYALTAKCTNIAGVVGTSATVSITTSNGISTHNWYFDSVAGDDSNNCQSSGAACQSLARMQQITLIGGDTLNLKAGSSWTMTQAVGFIGLGSDQLPVAVNGAIAGIAGVCRITVPTSTVYQAGSYVVVSGIAGVTGCNVSTTVSAVVDSTHIELAGTTFGGTFTGSGSLVHINVFPGAASITVSTYGGGTCNNYPGGTTTGCATFLYDPASTQLTGLTVGNVANFTLENIIVSGNGNTAILAYAGAAPAGSFPPLYAGIFLHNKTGTNRGIVVNNVQVMDVGTTIYGRSSGGLVNWTVENSFVGSSNTTNKVDNGIFFTFPGVTGTISGNYVQNFNGHANTDLGYDNSCCGSGIKVTNGNSSSGNPIAIFDNVVNTGGKYVNSCGAGYGIWTFAVDLTTINNNEVYNVTAASGACDEGAFDVDGGSTNTLVEYNYAHNNVGNAVLYFNQTFGGAWKNNIARYNILENNGGANNLGGTPGFGMQFAQASSGHSAFYNNTVWSNAANTFNTAATGCWGVGQNDAVVANNICIQAVSSTILAINNGSFGAGPNATLVNNYYYSPNFTGSFASWGGVGYSSLASFQAATGKDANSIQTKTTNPIGGTPPAGTCYSGSGAAIAPNACAALASAYQLPHGSPAIGAGADLNALLGFNVGTVDFYENAIPNTTCGGSGFNMGADGACH